VFEAFAEPKDESWDSGKCREFWAGRLTCCWREVDGDFWCQDCDWNGTNCGAVYLPAGTRPGLGVLPEGRVLQQPTLPPTSPFVPPVGGGVLQQPTPTPILSIRNGSKLICGLIIDVYQDSYFKLLRQTEEYISQ
jgi:hypothetical protein